MIYLESVGSYLDPKKGIIYPALVTNEPDLGCPIDLIDDEAAASGTSPCPIKTSLP